MLTAEMNPREGALAAQWLQLKTVLPCHFINPDCPEVAEFQEYLSVAKKGGAAVPEAIVMKPGDTITTI